MKLSPLPTLVLAALLLAPASLAQSAKNSAVAVNPAQSHEVWVCNRGNDSVSVVNTTLGFTMTEIAVGVWPRSIAFTPDGATAFVANQRGNVDVRRHFVTPFTGTERRGTISVIDVPNRTVIQTLEDVGTEPYGLAVAPSGAWFAVTGFRSRTVRCYRAAAPYDLLASFDYDADMSFIRAGLTVLDVDSNKDFIADCDEPRALTITADDQRIFVTHNLPGFVSVLDVTLNGGLPTTVALDTKIDLNTYTPHPIFDPTPVQTLQSQGTPRFLDDLALSPDGTRLLVPHVLQNINHDVNHDFGPGLAGDFANRVYPALTVVDAANLSYAQGGDTSTRLHHELSDPAVPAEHVPFGGKGLETGGGILTLGGVGAPVLGGTADYVVTGSDPSDTHILFYSFTPTVIPTIALGTIYLGTPRFKITMTGATASLGIPNDITLAGMSGFFQTLVIDGMTSQLIGLTNPVETIVAPVGFAAGKLGYRAGHPGRVLFNADGDRALLVNRGSEDVFLFSVCGSDLTLMTVFPPRHGHVERAALDTTTPMGDLPLGMTLVEDAATTNRDAVLYVMNETSRTLSSLRIDWDAGTIAQETGQIGTLLGSDQMTASEQLGQEIFEDASRAQTAGNFNNSCSSCHFEGGADGNVWQRDAGPRSTMPVYGGTLLTGSILWKGQRVNMGETGPMFGGENGGTGILTDVEQQALVDYHEIIPVPLNPYLDPFTGDYTANAAFGRDLFFGSDLTGLNMSGREAGCTMCHPDFDDTTMTVRGYTNDFLDPMLTSGENLESFDPLCFSIRNNILQGINIRNVNSAVNVDIDGDTMPEMDRNADGIIDIETYIPMNPDKSFNFDRDDTNSYLCYNTPGDPGSGQRSFDRDGVDFSIPTKLGVFSTGPYFHDHAVSSLRMLLDPGMHRTHPVYGDPSFPGLNKLLNEFHDIRGDESVVPNASKVQLTLQTLANGSTFEADIEALLEYITSL